MEREFCTECREYENYIVSDIEEEFDYKGIKYKYPAKKATCQGCGLEMHIDEFHDFNLESFSKAFREKNGIN